LATIGIPMVYDNDINNLDDIYKTLITNKQTIYSKNNIQQIKYPTYPSNKTQMLCDFEVSNGG
jgi:hypothetical protein